MAQVMNKSTSENPSTFNIVLQFDGPLLRVTSPDVPGLHLCSENHQDVMDDMIPAIKLLTELNK
jgi:hypothetical protein